MSPRWTFLCLICALLLGRTLHAVMKRPYRLKDLLAEAKYIAEGKVLSLDVEKRRAVFEVRKDLKGKLPFRRLNVVLVTPAARKEAAEEKEDDAAKMLPRLRVGLPLVIFAPREKESFLFFGFTEGTWFSLESRTPPPPAEPKEGGEPPPAAVCSFLACEIYMRRTFAGTTKELLALIPEILAGKREPPAWNPNEPPGLGPVLPEVN
jgi:hypothetical protein